MHQIMLRLLARGGVCFEEHKGDGSDLSGGQGSQGGNAQDLVDGKEPEVKPGKKQPSSDGESDDADDDKTGKSGLSDEAAKLLRDVMKQKERAKLAEEELKTLRSALGDLKPEDVSVLVSKQKEQERLELEKRGEYDRILEQVKQEQEREKGTLQEQIASLREQLNARESTIQEMTVGRSFSESAFIREKSRIPASIARKEFGAHVDLVEGEVVVYDKPRGASERTPIVDANGKYKSFEEAIAYLYSSHSDAKDLIKAQGKPGSGSGSQDLGGKKPDQEKTVVSGVSRIAQALNKGQ